MARPHNILLLAFPNGQLLDIAGPLQMFAGANDEVSRPVYGIEIAAPEPGPFPKPSTQPRCARALSSSALQGSSRGAAQPHTGPSPSCCRSLARHTRRGAWSRITAGGVTSGIDFGLRAVAEIAGEAVAQAIQLGLEYDPDPPFASGHPDQASATVKTMVSPRYETARVNFRAELSRLQAA